MSSTRRQARAADVVGTEGVPRELLNPDHPVWATAAACEAWADEVGIDLEGLREPVTPPERLAFVIPRYAVAAGHTDPRSPAWPDRAWLRETGLWAMRRACRRRADQIEDPRVRVFGRLRGGAS